MNVMLRAVDTADLYPLWLWVNDPAARAASSNQAPIEWETHVAWLAARLTSPDALILIAHSSTGRPLGTIRFETDDGWMSARLSYLVAPESRGLGVGRALLTRGVETFSQAREGTRLVALVRGANGASRHLFTTLGWAEDGSTEEFIRFVQPSGRQP